MAKYLTKKEISDLLGDISWSADFSLMSQDSYNETAVGQSIIKTGKKVELMEATLNIAIVGVGNKKYGNYRKADNIIDIAQLLSASGVKLRLPQGSILKEEELTVGRLCRFYRYHIQKYVQDTGSRSYLFRKYTDQNIKYLDICFRGGEYLDGLTEDQINYLRKMYTNMDTKLNTDFVGRFDRIQQAKMGLTYIKE